jgi:hypothetical protein
MRAIPALFTLVTALCICAASTGSASADDDRGRDDEAARAKRTMRERHASMQSHAKEVRDLLRVSRRRGSRAQIACVDESLSRVDVALRNATVAQRGAEAAWDKGDRGTGRALGRRVDELARASQLARATARGCAPHVVLATEGTKVTVTVDGS